MKVNEICDNVFCRTMILVWCFILFAGQSAQAQQAYTLGVLNLEPRGVSNVEAEILSDELRHQLNVVLGSTDYRSSGLERYMIVERTEMDRLLEEFEFEYAGCVSDSCALELGRMLQADRMVIGTVGKLGETYTLSARLIDIETAKTLRTASQYHRGEIDGLLTTVAPAIARDLLMGTSTVITSEDGGEGMTPIPSETEEKPQKILTRRSPATAFLLSFLPPLIFPFEGGGHYYNGEKTKGHITLLIGVTGFALLAYGSQEVEPENDPLGLKEKEPRSEDMVSTGGLIYIINWLYSSFNSYRSAKRINGTIESSQAALPEVSLAVGFIESTERRRVPTLNLHCRF